MDTIAKLVELFSRMPGIGPRQARRIVYFLLTQNHHTLEQLANGLRNLKQYTEQCKDCHRYFAKEANAQELCITCRDERRSDETCMIVEKDVDFENIERSGVFDGRYFILGGTISFFEKNPEAKARLDELKKVLEKRAGRGLKEVILAFSATPAGEETTNYVKEIIEPIAKSSTIKVSLLGRGLSTGSELEYSDAETIKNAFTRRV